MLAYVVVLLACGLSFVFLQGQSGCQPELPWIEFIDPPHGRIGDQVNIIGSGFGNYQWTSRVFFVGADAGPAIFWSDTLIIINVPEGAETGYVVVMVGAMASNPFFFEVVPWECIDRDGDGFGDPPSEFCPHPGWDCDDWDPGVNPGIDEVGLGLCDDGIDQDCDGSDCSGSGPNLEVMVLPAPMGNPLSRHLEILSDVPCSLSGYVTHPEEVGHGPSVPQATTVGTEHELWFFGLFPESTFTYTIHLAGQPEAVLASGEFETAALPSKVPQPEEVWSTPEADPASWVAMSINNLWGGMIAVFDREGRYRFYHETEDYPGMETGPFLEGLTYLGNGDLAWTNRNDLPAVRPDGSEYLLFEVQLVGPYMESVHHTAYIIPGEELEALTLFNLFGPGVECDLTTPTDQSVGDGVARLDAQGVETWRWTVFDSQTEIPPEALSTCPECWFGFWGPDTYDFSHANSVSLVDSEDAFVMSIRNLSRVVKVDMATGEVVWSMGDGLDFTWIESEPGQERWFYFQHDATWLGSGRLLIFDNRRGRPVPCEWGEWSRAMELEVDEEAMTVRLVWEHRVAYGHANGNAQRLPSGNTLISGGWSHEVDEVTQDGEVVWHFAFPNIFELPNLSKSMAYPATWSYGEFFPGG